MWSRSPVTGSAPAGPAQLDAPDVGVDAQAGHALPGRLGEVDRLGADLGLQVEPGQLLELAHQLAQAGRLRADELGRLGPRLRGRRGPVLEGGGEALDRRHRRAQLVGDVGEELALAGVGGLQPLGHAVERLAQAAQLVVGLAHPRVEAAARDRLGAVGQVARPSGAGARRARSRAPTPGRPRSRCRRSPARRSPSRSRRRPGRGAPGSPRRRRCAPTRSPAGRPRGRSSGRPPPAPAPPGGRRRRTAPRCGPRPPRW